MEILDIVDEQGNIIGEATRAEAHSNPQLIHQVVHAWIFNSQGQLLIQQRSLQKDLGAGMWDLSAAGHLLKGDSAPGGLKRELEEELGVNSYEAHRLFSYITGTDSQTELIYVYHVVLNDERQEFIPDPAEISQIAWVDLSDLAANIRQQPENYTNWFDFEYYQVLQQLAAASVESD